MMRPSYTEKADKIKALIAERGLQIERRGLGWRVYGNRGQIDVLVRDLPTLTLEDISPPAPNRRDDDPRTRT